MPAGPATQTQDALPATLVERPTLNYSCSGRHSVSVCDHTRIPLRMNLCCLMPTYGRPSLVQNAIACFLAQDYPAKRRRLLILDDAGQIAPQEGDGWSLCSTPIRMPTLIAKYAALEAVDAGWADAFVIWDDDDIYLPWHLSAHAIVLQELAMVVSENGLVALRRRPKTKVGRGGILGLGCCAAGSAQADSGIHPIGARRLRPSALVGLAQVWRRAGPARATLLRVRLGPGQALLMGDDEPP